MSIDIRVMLCLNVFFVPLVCPHLCFLSGAHKDRHPCAYHNEITPLDEGLGRKMVQEIVAREPLTPMVDREENTKM